MQNVICKRYGTAIAAKLDVHFCLCINIEKCCIKPVSDDLDKALDEFVADKPPSIMKE